MTEKNPNQDTNKYLFINLVTMLGIGAMQQLGKIINPIAGKAAINLDAAQATIDTLDMLTAKTRGNLDNDEERLLKETLSTLKMNFVETRDEEMKNASAVARGAMADAPRGMQNEKPSEEPKDAAPKSEPPAQEKSEPKQEKESSKFHKSYS